MLVEVRPTRSLQEIIKRRQQYDFVGRERQVNGFRENLALPLDDERRRFIYDVYGEGGVGKTWLLRRFHAIAQQNGMITAWSDDAEGDVVAVMEQIAARIEAQGRSMAVFVECLRAYRQTEAGSRVAGDTSRSSSSPAFTLLEGPIAAVRAPIERPPLGFANRRRPTPSRRDFASAFDASDSSRMSGHEATLGPRLLEPGDDPSIGEPIRVLSATFIRSLRAIAQDVPIGLFFDGFEHTGGFLEDWLCAILEGRYGELPASTIIGIAGREKLDGTRWGSFESVIAWVPLDRFSDEEARTFLARKGIVDEAVIGNLIRVSGRLPALLATAALGGGDRVVAESDDDAVGYFLQSLDDPRRRAVVLDAALPRRLDADLLSYLIDRPDAAAVAEWLRNLPFVEKRQGAWVYREGVRDSLVRRQRRESPERWAATHGRLAAYYEGLADGLHRDPDNRRDDPSWQGYALEALYHHLCASPSGFLPKALGGFVRAFGGQTAFARRWCETIEQAGADAGDDALRNWGRQLADGVAAYADGRHAEAADLFDRVIAAIEPDARCQPEALSWHGRLLYAAGRIEQALRTYTRLVEQAPDSARYWVDKGVLLARLGHYPQAVEDFDRALTIEPDSVTALANRAEAHRLMEAYDRALADYSRVMELDPDNASILGSRGRVYVALERFEDALSDLNRALALAPDEAWILAERGSAYRGLRRYEEALTDLNRALRLKPDSVWALAVRGDVYWQLKRYDAARADFNRALDLQVQHR